MDFFSWFVGIVEGEGYLGIDKSKNSPEFTLSMSDKDIIEKISVYLGVSYRTYVPSGKTVSGNAYKTQYKIAIRGRKAFYIAEKLEPYLSERRKLQVKDIRENYKPKITYREGYIPKDKEPINLPF